jgi:hypothetical protein
MKEWAFRVFDFDRERPPAVFWAVATTSLAGLLVCFFRWSLVGILTVFVEPMLEIGVFLVFGASLVWAAVHALRLFRGLRRNRFTPLLLAIAALGVFIFVPFTKIYLRIDFARHLQARTAAAQQLVVSRASMPPNEREAPDLIPMAGLSDGGEAMYLRTQTNQMVFFFTFRGILEHFSGFVYSATDAAPETDDFGGNLIEVDHLRPHWYWVASI